MKRLLCGAAVAAALLISATPSSAQVVNMTATLTGAEETTATPGVLGILTGAVGTATVAVDATNEELAVTLSLFNFATGTTAGHIHVGPRGVAGPVVLNFPIPTQRTGDLPLIVPTGLGGVRRAAGDRHQHDTGCHSGHRRRRRVREHPHVAVPGR